MDNTNPEPLGGSRDAAKPDTTPSSTISVFDVALPSWMVIAVAVLVALGAVFGIALSFDSGETTVTGDDTAVAVADEGSDTGLVEAPPDGEGADQGATAQDDAGEAPAADGPREPEAQEPQAQQPATSAGTYVISEDSALAALRLVVQRPESAEGSLIVDQDGTVRGTFTLIYWDTYGNVEDELLAKATAVITLVPVQLEEAESGLVFETVVDEDILIEAPDRTFSRPVQLPVTGRVDPEVGLLELALSGDTGVVRFRR